MPKLTKLLLAAALLFLFAGKPALADGVQQVSPVYLLTGTVIAIGDGANAATQTTNVSLDFAFYTNTSVPGEFTEFVNIVPAPPNSYTSFGVLGSSSGPIFSNLSSFDGSPFFIPTPFGAGGAELDLNISGFSYGGPIDPSNAFANAFLFSCGSDAGCSQDFQFSLDSFDYTFTVTQVPEPSILLLFGASLLFMVALDHRFKYKFKK